MFSTTSDRFLRINVDCTDREVAGSINPDMGRFYKYVYDNNDAWEELEIEELNAKLSLMGEEELAKTRFIF